MFNKLFSFMKKEETKMEDKFNSEALAKGIRPNKPVDEMTPEEIQEFLSTIDVDAMGFLGREGADNEEN